MNTRKIVSMSLLAVLCGCQPETPAQVAAPANAAPPVEQAAAPANGKVAKPLPAANRAIAAAEQPPVAPPASAAQVKPTPQGGESGTMLKSDDIKAEPFRDAKTIATLATGDKVDILKKDGGWYQVKSAKGNGWVRMLSIRKGEAVKGGSSASGLLALGSGRAGTGKVVATTGIRGLNEEELKAAKFDEEELKRAESYAANKQAAAKFAAQGKLLARKFDYLPTPK